ncbi:MAG: methionine aminotransferase [Bacteroidia bacterium]
MQQSITGSTTKLPGIGTSIFAVMSGLANECGAINLSQGFPDFECPPHLVELVAKYLREGKNQYAPMPGLPALKEEIALKTQKLYGTSYDPDKEITITSGATEAIYAAITSVVKEDDEVLIFEPAYDSYVPSILLNRGKPRYVRLEPPHYKINWEEVKKEISYRTRAIILNSPHNPTGTVLSSEDIKQLEKLVSGTDIIIISDEVYEHIIFDKIAHHSICRYPSLAGRSFVIFSFGKTYHNTGWKMGYVLAPSGLMTEFRKVFQYLQYSSCTPFQYAFADFMKDEAHYLSLPDFYQNKRDLFAQAVEASRFQLVPCHGTYFQCLDYSAISDEPDRQFAEHLTREFKIASIPISVFYHEKIDNQILRFCFAKSEETLKKAGELLCKI